MELSGRPKTTFEISAHRFLALLYNMKRVQPSSMLHGLFLSSGFSWLFQRSLHCFPERFGTYSEIISHWRGPISEISSIRIRSYSPSQARFYDFFNIFYRIILKIDFVNGSLFIFKINLAIWLQNSHYQSNSIYVIYS